MTRDQMRDILLSDFERWQAREAAQQVTGSRASLASYAEDQAALRGIGLVTSRETRYSERWKPTKLSVKDRAINSAVVVTYADGTRKIIKQARKSSKRNTRSAAWNSQPTAERTRRTHTVNAADLAPLGNIE